MGGGAEPPPQAGMKEAQEKDTDGLAMVGRGVTGCGQKVSATSLCTEDELDGFLLLPSFLLPRPATSSEPSTWRTPRKCLPNHCMHE